MGHQLEVVETAHAVFEGHKAIETGHIEADDSPVVVHPPASELPEMCTSHERFRDPYRLIAHPLREAVGITCLPGEQPVPAGKAHRLFNSTGLFCSVRFGSPARFGKAAIALSAKTFVTTGKALRPDCHGSPHLRPIERERNMRPVRDSYRRVGYDPAMPTSSCENCCR